MSDYKVLLTDSEGNNPTPWVIENVEDSAAAIAAAVELDPREHELVADVFVIHEGGDGK